MIDVQQLSYRVASKTLVDQVNLSLKPGRIHALLGANGAGKTTLLKLLTKDLLPTHGHILWQNAALSSLDFQQLALQRAVLSQQEEVSFAFNVVDIIQLGISLQPPQKRPGLGEIARKFDVEPLLQQNFLTLSGGEKQRVQLARVFGQLGQMSSENLTGKWLLLDEWTTGLDLKHQQSILKLLRDYATLGLGILMVVHDLNLALSLADECHLMQQGKLVASGHPQTLLTSQTIETVFGVKMQRCEQDDYSWLQLMS